MPCAVEYKVDFIPKSRDFVFQFFTLRRLLKLKASVVDIKRIYA